MRVAQFFSTVCLTLLSCYAPAYCSPIGEPISVIDISGSEVKAYRSSEYGVMVEVHFVNKNSNGAPDEGKYELHFNKLDVPIVFDWNVNKDGWDSIQLKVPKGILCEPFANCGIAVPENQTGVLYVMIPTS